MVLRWSKWLTAKASRDTTSGQFIPEIDGLRFIAIFSVILFHLTGTIVGKTGRTTEHDPLASLFSHGHFGVQLFFVISGAVIALPFAKGYLTGEKLPNLKNYFLRRLTRLEPPYIVHLLIRFALIILIAGNSAEQARNQLPHLLASLAYLHNIIYGVSSTISNVAWSLEVELQFYILAPFITSLFMIKSKKQRRIFLVLLIALFSLISFLIDGSPRFHLSILCYAHFFLTGFLLIDVYITEWNQAPVRSLGWDIVSVLSWSAVVALFYQGEVGRVLFVVPLFIAYCSAFKGVWSNRFLCYPLIYIIGGMCYTIYLYHFTVFFFFAPILNMFGYEFAFLYNSPLWFAIIKAGLIVVPIVLLISAIFFVFIEKPCMARDWHIKLFDRFKFAFKRNSLTPRASNSGVES